jgi:hypothetical protein
MRPTRFYSNKQERQVAKVVGGKKTANSGATKFRKGDVIADDWLFECKTHTEERQQFTIKREWIEKNKEEAFQMGKHHSAIVIDFGDGENYYLIDEKSFLEYKELLDGCNN